MIVLSKEQIFLLHKSLIERYGGTPGVRDEGLLDSALNAPFQSFGGADFFPSIVEKAARLGYGLVKNHPFHDGNKRIGALAMLTMLDLNHLTINTSSAEVAEVFLKLADSKIDEKQLVDWVLEHVD